MVDHFLLKRFAGASLRRNLLIAGCVSAAALLSAVPSHAGVIAQDYASNYTTWVNGSTGTGTQGYSSWTLSTNALNSSNGGFFLGSALLFDKRC